MRWNNEICEMFSMNHIKINYSVAIKGVLSIDSDGKMTMSVEDIGDIELDQLLKEFDGREVVLSVQCDANYPTSINK